MHSVGDGEPQGVVGTVAKQEGACPTSEGWPLLSLSQLLPVWKLGPSVAGIFIFMKKIGNHTIRKFIISEYWLFIF